MLLPHLDELSDDALVETFGRDPGIPYSCSPATLRRLRDLVGEEGPVGDAILRAGNASDDVRAEFLGISVQCFRDCNNIHRQ